MKLSLLLSAAAGSLGALSPGLVFAQSIDLPEETAERADSIVVTANRTERDLSRVGESVTVVGLEEIVERQPTEVLDVLRTVPGLTLVRNGGIGTTASVSIRGAESDQTVVLVDGVKLNDPASPGGGFNFGSLLTGNIARIEVVRGPQSVLYGSQAIGGVVNLITREPTEDPSAFVRAEYGSRDTAHLVGNVSGRSGPVAMSAGATYLRTDGISVFSEERGGVEADGFESFGANGKMDIFLAENIALDLRAFYTDSEVELDGFAPPTYAFGDTDEFSKRTDFVGYAGLNAEFLDGRFRNRLGFAYTNIDRRNLDPDGGVDVETFDANGENRRYEYQGVLEATDQAELVFGAEHEEAEFRSASYGGAPDEASVWTNSLYGQLNVVPATGLSLTGGVRYDDHELFGDEITFAASGAYTPNGGATVLRASYGEGFKAPSLYQLYSDYGNEALRPEEAESWDIGVTQRFFGGRAEVGATYFERDSTNLIDFVSCFGSSDPGCAERPNGYYDNIDLASAHGLEFGLALRPVDGFNLSASYTWLETEDEATGNDLARRAGEKFSLVADYETDFGFGLGATVLVVGDSFDNASNTRRLDGYTVADIRASYAINEAVEVFGRMENVFDEEFETAFRYGQPGRSVFGGVRLRM